MKNVGLIKEFENTLRDISRANAKNFSGIGLVLYNSKKLSKTSHCNLRPKISCPKRLKINDRKLTGYLLRISNKNHTLHDGFHFINEKGYLTHVAQYFVPSISKKRIKSNGNHGVRFRSAQYGSLLRGGNSDRNNIIQG